MRILESIGEIVEKVLDGMSGKDKKHILKDSMILFAAFNAPFVPAILIPILSKNGYKVEIDPENGITVVKDIHSGKIIDALRVYKKLMDEGVVTEAEFTEIKAKVLHLKAEQEAGGMIDEATVVACLKSPEESEHTVELLAGCDI